MKATTLDELENEFRTRYNGYGYYRSGDNLLSFTYPNNYRVTFLIEQTPSAFTLGIVQDEAYEEDYNRKHEPGTLADYIMEDVDNLFENLDDTFEREPEPCGVSNSADPEYDNMMLRRRERK